MIPRDFVQSFVLSSVATAWIGSHFHLSLPVLTAVMTTFAFTWGFVSAVLNHFFPEEAE